VRFMNYLPPAPMLLGQDPLVAARTAEAWDFASGGGYRTALFARPSGGAGIGLRDPALVWATVLQRTGDVAVFTLPGGGGLQAQSPLAQAAIAALVEGPAGWAELRSRTAARLMAVGGADAIDAGIDDMLVTLWRQGLAAPALPVG